MDTNQNATTMPIARLDPAVMNLDPSLSHLDKSALPTTKDNASRCIGDGPAFIDAIKIPFFNSTAESRKELTGTTADEQGMRLTNPTVGAANANAPIATSNVTDPAIAPPRAYANTGSSMFQRAEESGTASEQQQPTGGPQYAYNAPHDLLTSAGPTRPPVGVNDKLEGQTDRTDNTADNSNLVAARGAFNDPTIASGQNLRDPNLQQGSQQQGLQQGSQQLSNVDSLTTHAHHLNIEDQPASFMTGDVAPARLSGDSQLTRDTIEQASFDPSDRQPRSFFVPLQDDVPSQRGLDIPNTGAAANLPLYNQELKQEIQNPPHLHHVSQSEIQQGGIPQQQGFQQEQGFQRSDLDIPMTGAASSLPLYNQELKEEIQNPPHLHHVSQSEIQQSGIPLQQGFQSPISSFTSQSELSRTADVSEDREINHPEFSMGSSASTMGSRLHNTTTSRDIPVQTIGDNQQQQFQGQTFQGSSVDTRPVVAPAEPFQPGAHSGLRYAEPTEGLPGHSTYRA